MPAGRPPLPTSPNGGPPLPKGAPPRPAGGPPRPRGAPQLPPRPAGPRPPIAAGGPPRPAGPPPTPTGAPPVPVPGGSPPRPSGRPPRSSGGPPAPGGEPHRPTGAPSVPGGQPPRPGGQPPRPGGQPPRPGGQPPRPGGQPPRPAGQPQRPGGLPPRPAGGPIGRPRPPGPSSPVGARPPVGLGLTAGGGGPRGPRPPPPAGKPPGGAPRKPAPPRASPPPPSAAAVAAAAAATSAETEAEAEAEAVAGAQAESPSGLGANAEDFGDLPPADDADDVDAQPIALPRLVAGRFTVEVTEAFGLSKHDSAAAISATKIDPYLKCTLGSHKKAPAHKGRVHKNQGKNVAFEETMTFNMTEPEAFVQENDIQLQLKVMNSNVLSDSVLAQAEISMLPFLVDFEHEGHFALYFRKRKTDPKEKAGGVRLRIRFRAAKVGYLVVTCREGRQMKNMELMGKQDPYCKLELVGQKAKRTKTIRNGGTDCSFEDEEVRLWIDETTWTEDLRFSCYDEDIGSDDLIGARRFDLLDFMSEAKNMPELLGEGMGRRHEEWYDIFQGKNLDKLSGQVQLTFDFYPAGKLTITSVEGRHLVDKDTLGRQDPYIVYSMRSDNDTANVRAKTKTDTDGGTDPRWDEESVLHVVDHHELSMEVYDQDTFGSDDIIGRASFSLLPIFRKGFLDTWVTLKNRDSWGKVSKCGEIHVLMDFSAPPGVGYPQLQPDMDAFDEAERVNIKDKNNNNNNKGGGDNDDAANKKGGAPTDEAGAPTPTGERPAHFSSEFSDADIEAAFRFVDLNKNGFIGTAHLRHILICMGELVTDEEIDEMIRMVDEDGDGRVSFDEFTALMVHPDPGGDDFDPKRVIAELQASVGASAVVMGLDAKELAKSREQDAATKGEKIKLLRVFAGANDVSLPVLQRAFDKFRLLDRGTGGTGFVDFATMCDVLLVEPTGEYKKLFKILDHEDQARVNMRELLLGLCNFSDAPLEGRCDYIFTIFDEDKSGTLDRDELSEILKANHLAPDNKAVQRKLDTIMRQADEDGSGEISREEFLVLQKKFPTLLLPKFDSPDDQ